MAFLRFGLPGKFSIGRRVCSVLLLGATMTIASPAQTVTTIHTFESGNMPETLVQATDGNLYGTTRIGGRYCQGSGSFGGDGCGTVFKITVGGTVTRLHNFCPRGVGACYGAEPYSALAQGTDGNLFGTTAGNGENGEGAGSVFEITPTGKLTTLHFFCSVLNAVERCLDGNFPIAGLVQATDGNFYGTVAGGGSNFNVSCNNFPLGGLDGCGTIFAITPSGQLTTLYNFCALSNCTDGSVPFAGMVQATDGNFYGTTLGGGVNCVSIGGCGTIFKMTPGGTLTTLYSFCSQSGCADGDWPTALIQATDGSFYGVTTFGGTSTSCTNGCGTIFRITASGSFTTLHSFDDTDGNSPSVPFQATDGNFYGTASAGGAHSQGTIYKFTESGVLTILYNFCAQNACPDGSAPDGLIQDTNGNFYGTTLSGGSNVCSGGCGTVYRLVVGLGPFVETQTTSGNVGAAVNILGTNLTGTTSVEFNGTPAVFTVVSSSLITTRVPAGATAGEVRVTTPSGVLSSNKEFRVTP